MTLKQLKLAKVVTAILLAALMGQAIILNNYVLAVSSVIIAIGLLFIMRSRVKEVIEDERDYQIAGKAARYAMTIFSVIACVAVFILISLREQNEFFEIAGSIIAYSVCSLLLIYSIVFTMLSRDFSAKRKFLYGLSVGILTVLFAIFGVRIFSNEDSWICENGRWVKHGNPNTQAPTSGCFNANNLANGELINWQDAVDLVENCDVKRVGQTHALRVTLLLKDGKELVTEEPKIDDIMNIAVNAREKCGNITIMTE